MKMKGVLLAFLMSLGTVGVTMPAHAVMHDGSYPAQTSGWYMYNGGLQRDWYIDVGGGWQYAFTERQTIPT